jgi:phosphoglycolate phosphatase-like HAD superfamily hydrolase
VVPACVVCGDSTPHLKPHPAPLLLAADQLKIAPQKCFYLGDDLRDVQAARAAGMRPVAVEWGYHSPDNAGPRTKFGQDDGQVPRRQWQRTPVDHAADRPPTLMD